MSDVYAVDARRGAPIQAVAPDHRGQLGSSGATLTVPSLAVANSLPAPRRGGILLFIPEGATASVRIGETVVAEADDQKYPGPETYFFPVEQGWRVSLFGDAAGFPVSISMAL